MDMVLVPVVDDEESAEIAKQIVTASAA